MRMRNIIAGHGRKIIIAAPLAWLCVFFLAPLLQMLAISFSVMGDAIPPYAPLFDYTESTGWVSNFNIGNYALLAGNRADYIFPVLNSLRLAMLSTLACLGFAFPIALWIARTENPAARICLLVAVLLPFWTSSLIRIYALIGLLSPGGYLNGMLIAIGIIDSPLPLLQTDLAVALGMIMGYLPLMVLPLYAVLARLDKALPEAAADLGAGKFRIFRTIILPHSMGGIMAGCVLVFIATLGEFVIPFLLGGPEQIMIGRVLWDEFFRNRDWPVAAALAMLLLVMVLVPLVAMRRNADILRAGERA